MASRECDLASTAEVIEKCTMIFRDLMNEDPVAWEALREAYHRRLERNSVTWVRHYVDFTGLLRRTDLSTSPNGPSTGPSAT
jgi:hypothetical protein